MALLEIACFNEQSALIAAASGADRIELCTEPLVGGTTPPISVFKSLKSNPDVKIPIYVMIRPHGRSFTYSSEELAQMKEEIKMFRSEGADGFVFGILAEGERVDEENCTMLIAAALGCPCTFHRAFDEISHFEMDGELEVLVKCGFSNVLTSGGKSNAVEGKEVLSQLVKTARGRIAVIVGGGVRSGKMEILRETGAKAFHSSAIVTTNSELASEDEVKLLHDCITSLASVHS